MSRWSYDIVPTGGFRVKPIKPIVAGTRGVFWVLAFDEEVYGIEAEVMMTPTGPRMSLQTMAPLGIPFWDVSEWALLVDGEVLAAGP